MHYATTNETINIRVKILARRVPNSDRRNFIILKSEFHASVLFSVIFSFHVSLYSLTREEEAPLLKHLWYIRCIPSIQKQHTERKNHVFILWKEKISTCYR